MCGAAASRFLIVKATASFFIMSFIVYVILSVIVEKIFILIINCT